MKRGLFLFSFLLALHSNSIHAQETTMPTIPYSEIPSYPENFASGNIIARFIDGLGYRFYWASEGLTEIDLAYKPSVESRSCMETIEHVYDLSASILNIAEGKVNKRAETRPFSSYEDLRTQSLINLKKASEAYNNKTEAELAEMRIRSSSEKGSREFPLWNGMNGQISDAIYHTGQLVTFRRTTENPVNPKVNVFMGKNRD